MIYKLQSFFLTNLNCYSSVTSRYAKNMTYISDLLGGGSTTTNIPGVHVAFVWIMLTTMNWQKIVFKQQQSTYGRMRIHNGQIGMNIYSEQLIDVLNNRLIVVMGLKVCASRFIFVVSVG